MHSGALFWRLCWPTTVTTWTRSTPCSRSVFCKRCSDRETGDLEGQRTFRRGDDAERFSGVPGAEAKANRKFCRVLKNEKTVQCYETNFLQPAFRRHRMNGCKSESARNQNSGPESGRTDRGVLSVEDASGFDVAQSTLPLSGRTISSPSTTMTPVISMSSLMEIRTKYALRRIDIVPTKCAAAGSRFPTARPRTGVPIWTGISTPGPSRFPYRGNDPDLALCGWSSRTTVPFSNRHSVSRSEFARGNFRSDSRIRKFGYLCVTDSGKKIASLHTC